MKKIYILFILLFVGLHAIGQTLDEAKQMYIQGNYKEALPIFEQEYAKNPNNASLNQWLGVCLFQTGRDLDLAEKLLAFASKRKIQDSYYYLALIDAQKMMPEKALSNLSLYQQALKRKTGKTKAQLAEDSQKLEVAQQLQTTLEDQKRMIQHTEDLVIIDSIIVKAVDLLGAYHLSPLNGELNYYGELNSIDNLNDAYTTVFFTENKEKVYFSEPDSLGRHDIYTMDKLGESYSNKKQLFADRFDFEGDMKYPYVLSDGVTIIFSAQEFSAFGGLSLYITRFNTSTNKYLKPEKLNTPFNSFSNDYLYVIDEQKQLGWFATDRNTEQGFVCVYTFIPNTDSEMIDSEDFDYLTQRALITSIKQSWKPETDYSSLISLAREDIPLKKSIDKDFDFILNDNVNYYKLEDFQSEEARNIYKQVIDLKNKRAKLLELLEEQRDSIIREPQKPFETRTILTMENDLLILNRQIEGLENKTRKEELIK